MDRDRRLEVLEAENERLRARVADLERAMRDEDFVAPVEWRLSPMEAQVMGVLLARKSVTKAGLLTALYGQRGERDRPADKIADVFICKLRRKLGPFDVRIETVWGLGWRIRAEDRTRLRGESKERRRA